MADVHDKRAAELRDVMLATGDGVYFEAPMVAALLVQSGELVDTNIDETHWGCLHRRFNGYGCARVLAPVDGEHVKARTE